MYIPRAPFGPRVQCRRVGKVSFFFSSVKVDVFSQVWMAEDKPDDSWRRGDRRRKCEVAQRADTTMRLAGKQEKKEGGGSFLRMFKRERKKERATVWSKEQQNIPERTPVLSQGFWEWKFFAAAQSRGLGPPGGALWLSTHRPHLLPLLKQIYCNHVSCQLPAEVFFPPLCRGATTGVCVCVRECARQAGKENAWRVCVCARVFAHVPAAGVIFHRRFSWNTYFTEGIFRIFRMLTPPGDRKSVV